MTRPAPRHSHGRGRNCGLSEYRRGLSFQSFSVEALEDRILLAGDIVAWQNPLIPADVNGDGFVAPNDLLFVANALLRNGSRSPGAISGDAAGEEDGSSHYLDVNGDGFLSSEDAHIIAMGMDGAHTTQVMQLRFELTDTSNNSIETTNVNDEVLLHVFVQDIRHDDIPSRGVTAAFLDVAFDASVASVSADVTFGDEYQLIGQYDGCVSPGRCLGLGNGVSDLGGGAPLGPDEFLLAKIPFNIDTAPVTAIDDDATTDTALNVSEDGPATIVEVTANDMMGGATVWRGEPATTLGSDSFLWDDPAIPVPTPDIIYGTDSITINGVGALQITALDTVGTTGNVTNHGNGTVTYDPNGQFDHLKQGESTTDTFGYTVASGSATDTATVVVTIEGKNDLPVANSDSGFYFTTAKNTSFTTANVLANDEDVDGDPLTILSLDTTGTLGIVANNGDGTFDYDPNGQFDNLPVGSTGTDTFTYTVSDGHGGTDITTVTIDIVGTRQVVFRLETSDLDGLPISEVVQSDSFLLNVYVQDVRQEEVPEDRGVFQAYLDVTHDPAFGIATGPFIHGANFLEETSGSLSVGLIDEAGGTQTGFGLDPVISGPLGPAEILLFSVVMEATAPGTLAFSSDPADVADLHDVALFAPPVSVHPDNITYHQMSILVTPAPVVADPDGGAGFTTDEDTPFRTGNVLDNDTDREEETLFVSSFDASSTIGIVTSNGDGTFDYDPNGQFEYLQPGESTTDMFSYTATDGDPDHMNSAMVTITILGVNDSPVAMDDGGVGFTTDENLAFTTQSVFSNDSDIEGDDIILLGCDVSSTVGQASCNPDGTIDYDPNGQFGNVLVGESVTDRIDYSITDGNGGFAEATAFITIEGSPPLPGTIGGFVFADVDHDGDKDVVERAIGGAEVRLVGEDALGNAVSRTAYTNSLGRFDFFNVIAGDYELIEVQPMFFVDGIDSVDGVIHTGVNDRISIETTHVNMPAFEVLFGERSLHPDFISIEDFVNTELRQGIVVGFDVAGNQVWNSVMDGWEGITSVVADFSADGNTAFLTVTRDTGETFNYAVPTDRTAGYFRVKGETAAGRVVQFIGTMSDLTPLRTTSLVDAAFASI
ncbi:MAG: Ig-like domain-containing protein [Pirellulaceae bacterium]|nr:Ig-like domain-containing protein [Pirellulaceae bacterium]